MAPQPAAERLARVEEKVDNLAGVAQVILARLDNLDVKFMPRPELEVRLVGLKSDADDVRSQVDGVKTSRRWAVATFLPFAASMAAVAVALAHH